MQRCHLVVDDGVVAATIKKSINNSFGCNHYQHQHRHDHLFHKMLAWYCILAVVVFHDAILGVSAISVSTTCANETLIVSSTNAAVLLAYNNASNVACTSNKNNSRIVTCDYTAKSAAVEAACNSSTTNVSAFVMSSTNNTYECPALNASMSFINFGYCFGASCNTSETDELVMALQQNVSTFAFNNSVCDTSEEVVLLTPVPSMNPSQSPSHAPVTFAPTRTSISSTCLQQTLQFYNSTYFNNTIEANPIKCDDGFVFAEYTCDMSLFAAAQSTICSDVGGVFYKSKIDNYYDCAKAVATVARFLDSGLCMGASCTQYDYEIYAVQIQLEQLTLKGFSECVRDPTLVFAPVFPPVYPPKKITDIDTLAPSRAPVPTPSPTNATVTVKPTRRSSTSAAAPRTITTPAATHHRYYLFYYCATTFMALVGMTLVMSWLV